MRKKISPEAINLAEKELKPFNRPKDLVRVGIFGSTKTAANLRWDNKGPDWLKIEGAGIIYPKDAVLDWLKKKAR